MKHKLQPVRIETGEEQRRPPREPHDRTLSEAFNDGVDYLTKPWSIRARGLIREILLDLGQIRHNTDNPNILKLCRSLENMLTSFRVDIHKGGVRGAMRAFNTISAFRGYSGSDQEKKTRILENFLANPLPA